MTKRLRVHLLDENAKAPSYAHTDDSGMDVFSIEDKVIPGLVNEIIHAGYDSDIDTEEYALNCIQTCYTKVRTGLRLEIPEGYEIQVRPKSGLAIKNGIGVLNSPATIDEGFRGELEVILFNISTRDYEVKKGQKIAQIVLAPVEKAEVVVMDETQRGTGGFGSTGLQERPLADVLEKQNAKTAKAIEAIDEGYAKFKKEPIKISNGSGTASYTVEEAM